MSDDIKKVSVKIERIFDAPRDLVWKAWTDPEMLVKWWGPKDYTAPVCKIDLRVGGKYLYCMQGPDGTKIWSGGTIKELIPLEKIVCGDSFADENGNIVSAKKYGMPEEWPDETDVTVTFEDADPPTGGGKTKLTISYVDLPDIPIIKEMDIGWNQSLDKLAQALIS